MTDISKAVNIGVAAFMKSHPPVITIKDAKHFYSTAEIIELCNENFYDPTLTEEKLYNLLQESNYELVNVGNGIMRWAI